MTDRSTFKVRYLILNEKETLIRERDVTYESMPGGVVFVVIGKDNFYIREANQYSFDMLGVGARRISGVFRKIHVSGGFAKIAETFCPTGEKKRTFGL